MYPYLVLVSFLLLVFLIYFLFVFFLEGERLTKALIEQGFEKRSSGSIIFWEYLWGFVDYMVVRIEPFLVGAYLFFFEM